MKKDRRRRDLAMIHIARKELGLDEDTYRAMLWSVARAKSAADLDYQGRRTVLDHLRARGFKGAGGRGRHPGRPKNMGNEDTGGQLAKVEALLADSGRPWGYANAMAKRMFNVERVQWLKADQLRGLIAALVIDRKRRGA